MAQPILVTGFDRFGYRQRPNASSEIVLPAVKEKYGELVEALILPTARNIAAEQLLETIKEIEPAAVVMFGISAGRKVRLERQAKNNKLNLLVPDNHGVRAIGKIDKTGAKSYASTLPLDDMYSSLAAANVPVRISNDAGTFICNEIMYTALHAMNSPIDSKIIPIGFIHLGNGLSDQLVAEASLLVVDTLVTHNIQ